MFRCPWATVRVLVPVLPPVVGVAVPDPISEFAKPVRDERRQVGGIRRRSGIQGSADLVDVGVAIVGIPTDHSLIIPCPQ